MRAIPYGRRAATPADAGVRRVAPSLGRHRLQTINTKAGGIPMVVDGNAERICAHALNVDPSVRVYQPQPFTIDLVDRRLLRTTQEDRDARRRHAGRSGPLFYTPDYLVWWNICHFATVLEVKDEDWLGDAEYELKLRLAKEILELFGYDFRRVVIPASPRAPLNRNLNLLQQVAVRTDERIPSERLQVDLDIHPDEEVPLGRVCHALGLDLAYAPWLFSVGYVAMDFIQFHMCASTLVRPAHGELGHLCLIERMMK